MKASELKVGDWIRITGVPGAGVLNYYIQKDTVRVYKKLVARNRPVRIRVIDEYGAPWYRCLFTKPNGKWEGHDLAVFDSDNNWMPVKRRISRK